MEPPDLPRVYVDLPPLTRPSGRGRLVRAREASSRAARPLMPAAARVAGAMAGLLGSPGVEAQRLARKVARLAHQPGSQDPVVRGELWRLRIDPLDSVRYAEFDFFLRRAAAADWLLDVSSPRLLPLLLLERGTVSDADLVNPDSADLATTRALLAACDYSVRAEPWPAERLPELGRLYPLVTCMSVLEHVPSDVTALRRIWERVEPGGQLLLSVPVAASAYEEFLNVDEYGLLSVEDGYAFGQRFYDQRLLEDRLWSVVGKPTRLEVYGERVPGTFARQRERRLRGQGRVQWEALRTRLKFRWFPSVDALPGIGVAVMEFRA